MLGGRAAEEIVYNELTVGAADDISKATGIARKMVTEYGMSSLGPVSYDMGGGQFWIARDIDEGSKISEEMTAKVDNEVEKIIKDAYEVAKELVKEHKDKLDILAAKLLEKETLDGDEFRALLN
jgi:cell division protease FtsH